MTKLRKCSTVPLLFSAILTLLPLELVAQSVERLFSTPETRAALDRLRLQIATGVIEEEQAPVESIIELPSFGDVEEEIIYALGGVMRKAQGDYTVWINDIAYDPDSLPSNMRLLSPFEQGQIAIDDPESAASYVLKPGQVLNLSSGQLYESYEYQAVLAAAAAAEAARLAEGEAGLFSSENESVILESAAVEAVVEAATDL